MKDITPIKITLSRGYKDKSDVVHVEVTFGHRLTGGDMFELDGNSQAEIPTQYQSLIVSRGITGFGTLPMPVPLQVLLSLTRTDREDLIAAYNRFALESAGGREPDFIANNKVRLAFGFDINSVVYDVVTFGAEVTGFDEVDADKLELSGLSHAFYLIGREITQLSQSEGKATLEGRVELDTFEKLDAADIANLQLASTLWRNSFRTPGRKLQNDNGESGVASGDKDRVDGGSDTATAVVSD